ncbi:MAG: PEP-CTERM sorting domain-containing protein, partial [Alphaproteobacteria bacterium]|nr:PEP-CTERM sorting domain-containing protein [Alphaproteobacteria bacterium]
MGEQFRLLFVTSSGIKANSTAIDSYNAFVRRKAAGNAALSGFSGKFRALVSIKSSTVQSSVDARDNTATTGTGVPIYWLNGALVADDYADFYSGSWD